MPRSLTALVVVAWACALTLSPVSATGAANPLRLTVGTLGSIGSLDPRHGSGPIAEEVWNLQYPTLTSLDPRTLDPAPGLASGWRPGPAGQGWIYSLRPGLTWSDGQTVTAADVVYSIDHARDEHGLTARALSSRSVAIVPHTFDRNLPGLLLHVVPGHVFSKIADLDSDLAKLGVADGPWHVTARTRDSVQLDAAAGPNGPALQQIVFRTYPSARSLIDALKHKQVDVVSGLPDSDVGALEALSNVTVNHASNGSQWLLRDRLADERVRQAISLAIDRTALVADAVHGVGTPGVVPVLALGKAWRLDDSTEQSLNASLDAQPERARRLLAQAPRIGRSLVVSIPGSADGWRVGAFVRRALEQVGIATTAAGGYETLPTTGPRAPDLVLFRDRITDDPFHPYSALDPDLCGVCARTQYLPSSDFTTLMSIAHSRLQRAVSQATVVGLFEPDTLQAFRAENVTGFLREPEHPSLVVFAPTVSQYGTLVAAPPPPGEKLSNTAYAVGAAVVLAVCAAAYLVAAWIRRRFVLSKETTHEG